MSHYYDDVGSDWESSSHSNAASTYRSEFDYHEPFRQAYCSNGNEAPYGYYSYGFDEHDSHPYAAPSSYFGHDANVDSLWDDQSVSSWPDAFSPSHGLGSTPYQSRGHGSASCVSIRRPPQHYYARKPKSRVPYIPPNHRVKPSCHASSYFGEQPMSYVLRHNEHAPYVPQANRVDHHLEQVDEQSVIESSVRDSLAEFQRQWARYKQTKAAILDYTSTSFSSSTPKIVRDIHVWVQGT